jgi:hypothetical protein
MVVETEAAAELGLQAGIGVSGLCGGGANAGGDKGELAP